MWTNQIKFNFGTKFVTPTLAKKFEKACDEILTETQLNNSFNIIWSNSTQEKFDYLIKSGNKLKQNSILNSVEWKKIIEKLDWLNKTKEMAKKRGLL